jgi:YVTN family beta-propeller protein
VVNPDDDSVAVIDTGALAVVARIPVGDEPRSVAVDPAGGFAYVANAAEGTVSVIRVLDPSPAGFAAAADPGAGGGGRLATGAEPRDLVITPDGRRVLVANSGQDSITVIDTATRRVLGHVDVRDSACNDPDRDRHFQPRGLAVTADSRHVLVTRFLSFVRPGGRQGTDAGKEGGVCRLTLEPRAARADGYIPTAWIPLAPRPTGFADAALAETFAFPNQLQSVVIRGDRAYLPNVAASPEGPMAFDVDTQAFVSQVGDVHGPHPRDLGALNLHLGARNTEGANLPLPRRLFFANPSAIAFTTPDGPGHAYVVAAGSDLLVKLRVDAAGALAFTVDGDSTHRVDLNDPDDPATSGAGAGKNPRGIVIDRAGARAYVASLVSRNVSVVDLATDAVVAVVPTHPLPAPGSPAEVLQVGAEVFFSSRGRFDRPPGTTVPTDDRLSSEGWQSCASCHPDGLTDGVVWAFSSGPRKSLPLNGTFDPRDPARQRVLNYSGTRDELEDVESNIRNVSGPGPPPGPVPCAAPGPQTTAHRNTHGLVVGDDGDVDKAPCAVDFFDPPNAGRPQLTVTLPGSTVPVEALTALREWVRRGVRTPGGPHPRRPPATGAGAAREPAGRELFAARCAGCHGGSQWTVAVGDLPAPPPPGELRTETSPAPPPGVAPVPHRYLARFLVDVGSYGLGVPGTGHPLGADVGAWEKAAGGLDALGRDHNGDGAGEGYTVPSLLGIHAAPPYYHNGACETLACVLLDPRHAGGPLTGAERRALVRFLESIDAATPPLAPGRARP